MEVSVTDQSGLPDGAIVSIKLGSTRRQAPLDLFARPLKFPATGVCQPLQVDVLQPIASGHLVLQRQRERYRLRFEPLLAEWADELAIGLQVVPQGEKPCVVEEGVSVAADWPEETVSGDSDGALRFHDAASLAQEYLEEHGLLRYMQSLLHAVIQDRPSDPYVYMADQLAASWDSAEEVCAEEEFIEQACEIDSSTTDEAHSSAPLPDDRAKRPAAEPKEPCASKSVASPAPALQQRCSELEAENCRLKRELADKQAGRTSAEDTSQSTSSSEAAQLRKELAERAAELESAKSEVKVSQEEMTKLGLAVSEFHRLKAELEKRKADLEVAAREISASKQQEDQLAKPSSELSSSVKAELDGLRTENRRLLRVLAERAAELSVSTRDLKAAQQQVAHLEQEGRTESQQNWKEEFDKKCAELEDSSRELNLARQRAIELEQVHEENYRLEEEMAKKAAELDNSARELTTSRQRALELEQLHEENYRLEASLAKKDAELDECARELADFRRRIAELDHLATENLSLKGELAKKDAQVLKTTAELRSALEEAKSEKNRLLEELVRLQAASKISEQRAAFLAEEAREKSNREKEELKALSEQQLQALAAQHSAEIRRAQEESAKAASALEAAVQSENRRLQDELARRAAELDEALAQKEAAEADESPTERRARRQDTPENEVEQVRAENRRLKEQVAKKSAELSEFTKKLIISQQHAAELEQACADCRHTKELADTRLEKEVPGFEEAGAASHRLLEEVCDASEQKLAALASLHAENRRMQEALSAGVSTRLAPKAPEEEQPPRTRLFRWRHHA